MVMVDSFTRRLPKIFGSNSVLNAKAIKTYSRSSCLSDLPTVSIWEDPRTSKGTKDLINCRKVYVAKQIRTNINSVFFSYPEAKSVVLACREGSMTFITILCSCISDTYTIFMS